jgi:type VI protein secretion system component VasF
MVKRRKKVRSTLRRSAVPSQKPREARLSRREQMAQARRQKRRRRQLITALVAVAIVAAVAALIWLNNRPLALTTVEAAAPASADGAAWGPADAPVVVEDWSDYQ